MANHAKPAEMKKCTGKNRSNLKTMCPQLKAQKLAYLKPSADVQAWMGAAHKRVCTRLAQERKKAKERTKDLESKMNHNALIGQLKAADARERIRQMRQHYEHLQAKERNLIIGCQASALRAMHLEKLLAKEEMKMDAKVLDPQQVQRVEELLNDEGDLTIIRRW